MLKPIVPPIPFQGLNNALGEDTIAEFKITQHDNALLLGLNIHKNDHISQNIRLASKFKEV